jgi:hypothetical protein
LYEDEFFGEWERSRSITRLKDPYRVVTLADRHSHNHIPAPAPVGQLAGPEGPGSAQNPPLAGQY